MMASTGSSSVARALGLLLVVTGCGYEGDLPTTGEPPKPPSAPTRAAVALALSPSPVAAVGAVDSGATWSADWTLTVRETAGIAGDIELVRATLAGPGGEDIAETTLGADEVSKQLGGSNHIQGGSSQQISMGLDFDFPSDVVSGDLRVTLELRDDRGNDVSSILDDVVQVCVPDLLSPEEGAMIDNGCASRENGILWEFDWSDCPSAGSYEFYLRKRSEQEPLFDQGELTRSSFTLLENRVVPEEGRYDWYWMVRANVNGTWGNWSPERNFSIEPANTDCVPPEG
jgi:hypothetical protein